MTCVPLGLLKPSPEIYLHLLKKYHLNPAESVFIDDTFPNMEGARAVGMHAILFTNTPACEMELKKVGVL